MKILVSAVALSLSIAVWELVYEVGFLVIHAQAGELGLYMGDKLGFALVLAIALALTRSWRTSGFAGGLLMAHWWLLWPIWADAIVPVLDGLAPITMASLIGWAAVSAAVGFGEEGLFRGLVMTRLGLDRPLRAILVSSVLFGAIHLFGLLSPIDSRLVLAQAASVVGLGLILGAVRVRTGSIWPGIIAHTILDFCGIAAAGGVTEAMEYSPDALYGMLGAGGVALLWGIILCWRIDAAALRASGLAWPQKRS